MKRALIGAGGSARETKTHLNDESIVFFVDDAFYLKNEEGILPLSAFDPEDYEVLVAVGNSFDRESIVKRLPLRTRYFSFIHPSALIMDKNISIGEGSIICANCILTTNIKIGRHCQLNIGSTISHDCVIGNFFTTAPMVSITGNCQIGNRVYFGTHSSTKQKLNICDDVVVGLGAGVVKDINSPGVYVGLPAKKIEK